SSPGGSAGRSVQVDQHADAPTVSLVADSGASSTDHYTSNGHLNVGGIESGATVRYSIDGGASWTTSFTAVEGANTVLVKQTDLAGNTSAPTSLTFTLDTATTAPSAALAHDTGASGSDHVTNNG